MDQILFLIEKALIRKVHATTMQVYFLFSTYKFCFRIIEEMIVNQIMVMEQIDKQNFIVYKSCRNVGIAKALNRNSAIVNIQDVVYVYFIFLYVFIWPILSSESSQQESTIIIICYAEVVTFAVLFNVLHLDVAVWQASIYFHESNGKSAYLQTVLGYMVLFITHLWNSYGSWRIVCYYHWKNRIIRPNSNFLC